MIDPRLEYLYNAYFSKTATPEEREELLELILKAEHDEPLKALLTESWQQFDSQEQVFDDEQYENMLSHILKPGSVSKTVPRFTYKTGMFRWVKFAAAAAVVIVVITGVYLMLNQKGEKQNISQSKKAPPIIDDVIMPGKNKATLTLSAGKSIMLDSSSTGLLVKQGNTKIIKLNTATLSYVKENGKNPEVVYNTLSTPRGGQYQLILPDGTKVWLNNSSSIYFPTRFIGKERSVRVTGEVYFEVASNKAMPFKVSVKDLEITVLGTHFNIMAYDDENSVNTTLLEGSVKVSRGSLSQMLVPGEESRMSITGLNKIVKADIEDVIAWKNGWFQFNSNEIKEIMRELSRWYDVDVIYEGKIPDAHFSGIVSRNNNIFQVLKIMQAGSLRFKIEGRKIIVSS